MGKIHELFIGKIHELFVLALFGFGLPGRLLILVWLHSAWCFNLPIVGRTWGEGELLPFSPPHLRDCVCEL